MAIFVCRPGPKILGHANAGIVVLNSLLRIHWRVYPDVFVGRCDGRERGIGENTQKDRGEDDPRIPPLMCLSYHMSPFAVGLPLGLRFRHSSQS